MTVEEHIQDIWPTTDGLLTDKVDSYTRAKASAMQGAIASLWAQYAPDATAPSDVDDMDDNVQRYIAMLAVRILIPVARDYYMNAAQSESRTTGGPSSVTQTTTKPDRLAALATLEQYLTEEMLRIKPLVVTQIAAQSPVVITTSSNIPTVVKATRIVDPDAMWALR